MNQNVTDAQASEIDLNQLTQKIGKGFGNFGYFIFNSIQFLLKHALVLIILIILGLAAGFYINSSQNKYDHKIIVLPNFNSNDYLYSKISLLNVKIKEEDTAFLKSIGFKNPKNLKKIEIEPIVDPYTFVKNNESNMEMLKAIAEDGSMEKVVKDPLTSMKYEYHQILFSTKGTVDRENMIDPLMNYLNKNEYFTQVQEKIVANIKRKIVYSEQTLNQVNGILDNFSNGGINNGGDSKLMYYNNENSQIDDILKTKNNLVNELGYYKVELINTENIVKEVSTIPNVQREKSIPFVFPLLFVVLYIFINFFISFYKRQKIRKYNELNV